MKVVFNSQATNYIEVTNTTLGKYQIVIAAQDPKNPLVTIINSVELTSEQFATLISDLDFKPVASNKE